MWKLHTIRNPLAFIPLTSFIAPEPLSDPLSCNSPLLTISFFLDRCNKSARCHVQSLSNQAWRLRGSWKKKKNTSFCWWFCVIFWIIILIHLFIILIHYSSSFFFWRRNCKMEIHHHLILPLNVLIIIIKWSIMECLEPYCFAMILGVQAM